ncbi:MAG: hypothetical protein FJ096_11785 [Deltaproteobacteria bacterium]|nr:hypothetical protein [Deltaproteobacteria bacterium]
MATLPRPGRSLVLLVALLRPAVALADPVSSPSIGRKEGEIDLDTGFDGMFGVARPGAAEPTWQRADTRVVSMGAGYAVGDLGPLHDCYARIEGGLLSSADERSESAYGPLPLGHRFYPEDQAGYVRGFLSANVVSTPRFDFGLFLQATLPLSIDLRKFSTARMNWVGGGTTVDVALTEPNELLRLGYRARVFVGSGAYDGAYQHNASIQVTNLLRLEAARWLLRWPVGLSVGPHLEADVNSHRNAAYANAYADVAPEAEIGAKVQTTSVAIAVLPYVKFTEHVALELGYQQVVVGTNVRATQEWVGTLRTAF